MFKIREEGASKLEAMKSDYETKARVLVSADAHHINVCLPTNPETKICVF